MNVHQLSIAYVPEQDRVLVRVNTQEGKELQFWLTRRLTLGLSPLLDKVVTEQAARHGGPATAHVASMDDMAKKVVAQFQRAETLKNADFATPYKASEASVPLFDHPLLVNEVNLTPLGNGQLRLSCAEKLPGAPAAAPRSFQMALSMQLVHAFVHLLERAVGQSQWRLAAGAMQLAAGPAPDPAAGLPDKPGYLN